MTQRRKRYNASFKFKVALEAAKGLKTVNEIASEYEVHPKQVSEWKKQLLAEGAGLFGHEVATQQRQQASREAELYEQLGRLQMELAWLRKKTQP